MRDREGHKIVVSELARCTNKSFGLDAVITSEGGRNYRLFFVKISKLVDSHSSALSLAHAKLEYPFLTWVTARTLRVYGAAELVTARQGFLVHNGEAFYDVSSIRSFRS